MVTNTSSAGIIKNIQKRRNGDQSIEPFHHHSQTNYSCQRRGLSWPHIIWRHSSSLFIHFQLVSQRPSFLARQVCSSDNRSVVHFSFLVFFFLDVKQIQQPKTGIVYNTQSELLFVLFCFFSCIISSSRLDGKEFFCSFLAIEIVQKGGLDMCQPAPSRLEI